MLYSLNLLEILPVIIINIIFFSTFALILILSYPLGRLCLKDYCENNLLKNSIFAIVVFATIISIAVNLAPIFAKYLIIIFYILNLFILIAVSRIRSDFLKAANSFRSLIILTFVLFLIFSLIYKPIIIKNNEITFFYETHYTYFINPISEIIKSDYFSRLKMFSIYPAEWGSYHFFSASFNSIFLIPIYESGTIGLITLKNFYLSIFSSLFFLTLFKKENFLKIKYFPKTLLSILIIFIFIFIFSPKLIWLIQSNGFVSSLMCIFIVQSFLAKNKNDFLIWVIILSLSGLRNGLISFVLAFYILIYSENFNSKILIQKIKESINFPNLLLLTLSFFYFLTSFYESTFSHPTYNIPIDRSWWSLTTTNIIIENYNYFLITFFMLSLFYLIFFKIFIKRKIIILSNGNDILYMANIFLIPSLCFVLFLFKSQIIYFYEPEKTTVFFEYFNLTNLLFYFLIPFIWSIILFNIKPLMRYLFITIIITYTLLSIFIYNAITLPAFYIVEIIILFYVTSLLLNTQKINKFKNFGLIFMFSIIVIGLYNYNIYTSSFNRYKSDIKFVFKINEIKELKKNKYLCPKDIVKYKPSRYSGGALSSILVIPFYNDITLEDQHSNWDIASHSFSLPSKNVHKNPCTN